MNLEGTLKRILGLSMRRAASPERTWNDILDSYVRTLPQNSLEEHVSTTILDLPHREFVDHVKLGGLPFETAPPHKKALEFFFSFKILDPQPGHHVLDAAGGRSGYLSSLRILRGCRHLYLSDHIFKGVHVNEDGVVVAGGDVTNIPIESGRIDRIACHHAFEHFQQNADSEFIKEVARLLAPNGKACIIPLFVTDKFVECWNIPQTRLFDSKAELLIDPSASVPGADEDGHFARFYDVEALARRVLAVAEAAGLSASIVCCRLDGSDLPNMEANFGSALNKPMRALMLQKTTFPMDGAV